MVRLRLFQKAGGSDGGLYHKQAQVASIPQTQSDGRGGGGATHTRLPLAASRKCPGQTCVCVCVCVLVLVLQQPVRLLGGAKK
jgi:hypothetical protein